MLTEKEMQNENLEKMVLDFFICNPRVVQAMNIFKKIEDNLYENLLDKFTDVLPTEENKENSFHSKFKIIFLSFFSILVFYLVHRNFDISSSGGWVLFSTLYVILFTIGHQLIYISFFVILGLFFIALYPISWLHQMIRRYFSTKKIKGLFNSSEIFLIYENLWKKNSELNQFLNKYYTDKEVFAFQHEIKPENAIEQMKKNLIENNGKLKDSPENRLLSLLNIVLKNEERVKEIQKKESIQEMDKKKIEEISQIDKYETLQNIFEKLGKESK